MVKVISHAGLGASYISKWAEEIDLSLDKI